jgi:hypothetical protein
MGKLLPSYKQSLIEELQRNILANTTQYYGFAANPVPSGTNAPAFTSNYENAFYPSWQLLFGKKINGEDILPVTDNNLWVSGQIYPIYDNIYPIYDIYINTKEKKDMPIIYTNLY